MKIVTWIVVTVFLLLLAKYLADVTTAPIKPSTTVPTLYPTPYVFSEDRLWDLIQNWKKPPYEKSEFLCSIASTRLEEVKANWSHQGFEADRFCTGDCYIGENLVKNFSYEPVAFNSWLTSASHRENLDANYTHSCLKCSDSTCVQIFGYY